MLVVSGFTAAEHCACLSVEIDLAHWMIAFPAAVFFIKYMHFNIHS